MNKAGLGDLCDAMDGWLEHHHGPPDDKISAEGLRQLMEKFPDKGQDR